MRFDPTVPRYQQIHRINAPNNRIRFVVFRAVRGKYHALRAHTYTHTEV